jgi:hypothetical protein
VSLAARLSVTPLPWQFARVVSWLLAVHGVVTGWDYIHTPTSATAARSLTIVERIATLHAWGVAFLVAGAVLTAGLVARHHFVVWLGHLLCSAMCFMFAIATAQAVVQYARSPLADTQGSIWRGVTQAFIITALHIALCYIRGPVPRRGDER